MPDSPPPSLPSPPDPAAVPAPPPSPAATSLSPYELVGDETAAPEQAPNLTFNIATTAPAGVGAEPEAAAEPAIPAAASPASAAPSTTPRPEPIARAPSVGIPGVIQNDDPPSYVPRLPAEREPLLDPRNSAPSDRPRTPPPPPEAPPIPLAPSPPTIAELLATPRSTPLPTPPPLPDLGPDTVLVAHSGFGDEVPPEISWGPTLQSIEPDADTIIATNPTLPRRRDASPSLRRIGTLVALLLALWLLRLGAAPLFDVDEGAFAEATRELVHSHDWGSTTLNGVDRFDKPILVYWLQAASLLAFGTNEFAVRLPSALCAFLWCLAIGVFAWRRYGHAVAIAAAGVLATSLGPMLIGRAATADALLNLLLTLAGLDLWRHLENGRAAPRRRAFAWIGLGLLAKGPVALLIPAAAVGLWLGIGRDRSRFVRLVGDWRAWAWLTGLALPWYAYAVWRHGRAFIEGFLVHHNLDRFSGSLEGHAGSLWYYAEMLPLLMLPWTPMLVPLVLRARVRWGEPLGRYLWLWLAFVLVFFSLSGTKLPHYVLYGFTPLVLLVAQELVSVRTTMRVALAVFIVGVIAAGAASPWIASTFAARTTDTLYRTLLSTAPTAPWVWAAVPLAVAVAALVAWLPGVRNYLSAADSALLGAAAAAAWIVMAVMPWWGEVLQAPVRILARTVPIAQLNLLDREPLVQWHLHQPSVAFYLGQAVRRDTPPPAGKEWAFTRLDRLTESERARYEIVEQHRGYALVRPVTIASSPLAAIGQAHASAEEASAAARAAEAAIAQQHRIDEMAVAASRAAARAAGHR